MDLIEKSYTFFRHPWELSRKECLIKELSKLNVKGLVLDIGCGDSFFDIELLKEKNEIKELWGCDIFLEECTNTEKHFIVNSFDKLPKKEFDFIIMMDVLEHIKDDSAFLKMVKDYLKPDGVLIITVPAFQRLFSEHDRQLKHFRRYNIKQLKKIIEENELYITRSHYFYTMLLFIRMLFSKKTNNLQWQFDENDLRTVLIKKILNIDFKFNSMISKAGVRIGGLSLYMTAMKRL